jgi:hypothetical protein
VHWRSMNMRPASPALAPCACVAWSQRRRLRAAPLNPAGQRKQGGPEAPGDPCTADLPLSSPAHPLRLHTRLLLLYADAERHQGHQRHQHAGGA